MQADFSRATERVIACGPDNYAARGSQTAAALGLRYPDLHCEAESMAMLSAGLARQAQHAFCSIPFCSTVEAEALGAHITLGDEHSGPRAGGYRYPDVAALQDGLGSMNFHSGRLAAVLKACALLQVQGWPVIVEMSGPLGILNSLLDFSHVLKAWRKDERRIAEIFAHLAGEWKRYALALQATGATVLSLADPMATVNILGPRYAASFSELFLLPMLRDIEPLLTGTLLHLCPKLAFMLTDLQYAHWHSLHCAPPLTYAEALIQSITNKEVFMGYFCIKRLTHPLQDGQSFSLRIC